ncbi:type VI secretion system baseplate subunit TssF [Thalassomonas viridans]|uniref:Type VI secretion system baseplate subunit TssF n=1 Tax=Thalassomonas viridans TaxID=137584 RepID=A0AAE9Z8P3_9GAMM|nr:type VI secretion system baseplate subunit TssF [Thalassomonas viridans]WDE08287.1 type VI secretion system baseplate subunit TssF [Thalassomonas viridans]
MNEDLLKYYNRELAFIRHMGAEFAEKYPKLAGRLRLSDEQVEDPHVSRLIEAFSLLTAQIRQKLDDSFPELTQALLGLLYPDYQAPIPSMTVIKMITENVSTTGITLPEHTRVDTRVEGMKPCHFRTCYQTELWPLEVEAVTFQNAPFKAPEPVWQQRPKAVIKLSLATEFAEASMAALGMKRLRFYLNGQPHQTLLLYQLLFEHCIGLAIAKPGETENAKYLQPRHIKAVGFDDEHQVVPYSQRTLSGYRLLVESFIFPEKFLFFELADLASCWGNIEDKCDIYLYLTQGSEDLEKQVGAGHFLLGCTPVINLFEQELEPVRLEPSLYEYKLAARYLDAEVAEIININEVIAYDPKDNKVSISPFYGESHPAYLDQNRMFWHINRQASSWAGGYAEQGTEVFLSLVDHEFRGFTAPDEYGTWLLSIHALCSNRNLPAHLPFGTGEPKMFVPARADIIKQVKCLSAPTMPVRAALDDASRWQLVSHLSLEHFTGPDALKTLKETLKLYDFKSSPENKNLIDNITAVTITSATARVNQKGRISFCNGSDIELVFAGDHYGGSGVFFFCTILDHFFAQYAAINSFTRLSVRFKEQEGIYHTWPSRAGRRPLL